VIVKKLMGSNSSQLVQLHESYINHDIIAILTWTQRMWWTQQPGKLC